MVVRRAGGQDMARSAVSEYVSGNYFRMFGVQPSAGRLLTDEDDVEGAPVAAVMSYAKWQRDYAADPAVVGSTFWVNAKPVTVVGIAPKGFYGDRLIRCVAVWQHSVDICLRVLIIDFGNAIRRIYSVSPSF